VRLHLDIPVPAEDGHDAYARAALIGLHSKVIWAETWKGSALAGAALQT
jgi:hypothetical protein